MYPDNLSGPATGGRNGDGTYIDLFKVRTSQALPYQSAEPRTIVQVTSITVQMQQGTVSNSVCRWQREQLAGPSWSRLAADHVPTTAA